LRCEKYSYFASPATLHPALGSDKADSENLEATDAKNSVPQEDLEDKVDSLADLMDGMGVKQDQPKCSICLEILPPEVADAVHCTACARQLRLAKTFEGMQSSTKVSRLLELLDEIKAEDTKTPKKTIVFSQVELTLATFFIFRMPEADLDHHFLF
jgi:hypothetical protein